MGRAGVVAQHHPVPGEQIPEGHTVPLVAPAGHHHRAAGRGTVRRTSALHTRASRALGVWWSTPSSPGSRGLRSSSSEVSRKTAAVPGAGGASSSVRLSPRP